MTEEPWWALPVGLTILAAFMAALVVASMTYIEAERTELVYQCRVHR